MKTTKRNISEVKSIRKENRRSQHKQISNSKTHSVTQTKAGLQAYYSPLWGPQEVQSKNGTQKPARWAFQKVKAQALGSTKKLEGGLWSWACETLM